LLELFERRFRHNHQGHRVVEIGLRAVRLVTSVFLRSRSRCFRSTVSARKGDAARHRGEIGFQIRILDAHTGEPRLGLRHGNPNGSGSISINALARVDALALGHGDLGNLAEMSGVISTFWAPM
jgi:hypothetical protein